jgi:DNA-binding NarL/FixJ family response regulator
LAVWFELEAILLVFETPDLDAIQDTLDKAQARYELDDVAAAFSRHELDSMREALALLRRATRASQDYILTHRAERKLNLVVASNYEAGVSAIAKVLDVTDDPIQAQRAREVALELRDAQERLNQPIAGESSEPLTAIELETLRGMAHGLSNQMIADEQRRTINTVRTHISSILRKLGVDSRGEAVAKGRLEGLV